MPDNANTNAQHPAPCPSCGHCPTCGRGGWGTLPWYPYPYVPTYPYPYRITWTAPYTVTGGGTFTSSDLMPQATSNYTLAQWGQSMTGGDTSHMID
jgi:hypothetical protein